jgi:ribosomal protein S18 acetylase RimI-like enzyme
MLISEAQPGDENEILAVANSVKFAGNRKQEAERGFLYFVKTAEEYRQRIKLSKFFLVAKNDNGKIIGFIIAHDRRALRKLQTLLPHEYPIQYVLAQHNIDVVYIEQLAVNAANQHEGVAQQMYDMLLQKEPHAKFFAAILHKPVPNNHSVRFFVDKNGWRLAERFCLPLTVEGEQLEAAMYEH